MTAENIKQLFDATNCISSYTERAFVQHKLTLALKKIAPEELEEENRRSLIEAVNSLNLGIVL